jgi:hypothetical protein
MTHIPIKQFKLDVVYFYGIVNVLFLLPLLIVTMGFASLIFTNEHLSQGVRYIVFFGTFFGSVYGYSYSLTARCWITVETKGITIKVKKWGICVRRAERFYNWAEVESFRDYQVRGGRNIGLYFRDDTHITFSDSKRALFDYLIHYFPSKKC